MLVIIIMVLLPAFATTARANPAPDVMQAHGEISRWLAERNQRQYLAGAHPGAGRTMADQRLKALKSTKQ